MPHDEVISAGRYSWSAARRDLVAGLTVAAIAVPQAMAYALIAGIEPRFGLYSAIVVTAVASVFGSSQHLMNGPTNAISLVVFSALAFVAQNPQDAVQATFVLAVMAGGIQILVAVFRLGDLTRYISESVVIGFMAGAGLLIALTQLSNLTGLKEPGPDRVKELGDFGKHILVRLWLTLTEGGAVHWRALVIGAVTVVLVVVMRKVTRRYHLPRLDMLAGFDGHGNCGRVVGLVASRRQRKAAGRRRRRSQGRAAAAATADLPRRLDAADVRSARWPWPSSASWKRSPSPRPSPSIRGSGWTTTGSAWPRAWPTSAADSFNACPARDRSPARRSTFRPVRQRAGRACSLPRRWRSSSACSGRWRAYIPKPALAGILLVTAAGLIDRRRVAHAVRASRFDALLVLATAASAVLIGVEFSILIGVGLSILMFVPRAARLKASELTVGTDRVVRDRHPDDPCCDRMMLLDLEGEFFFGAGPELDRYFDALRERKGLRVIVLRVKRTRNPDIVCMERLQHFIVEMRAKGVPVLLCGVRPEFAQAMKNLRFEEFLPDENVFREEPKHVGSSTLAAVRHAYELLGDDICAHCPRRTPPDPDRETFYYQNLVR